MGFVRPPLRDRMLLHLLPFTGYEESHEVPPALTQMGMAKALGCQRAQVAQVLIESKTMGMVLERVCHVQGSPRRLKAYVLTPDGRGLGEEIRRAVLGRVVQLVDEDGRPNELTARQVLDQYPKQLTVTGLLRLVGDDGALPRAKVTAFIETGGVAFKDGATGPATGETASRTDAESATETPVAEEPPASAEPPAAIAAAASPGPGDGGAPGVYDPRSRDGFSYYGLPHAAAWPTPELPASWIPPPQPPPRSIFARGSLLLGFTLLFVGGLLPFMGGFYGSGACLLAIFLFVLGAALMVAYFVALRIARVETLPKWDRYSVLIVALALLHVVGFLATLIIPYGGFTWSSTALSAYLTLQGPLYFVLAVFFLIPAEIRGQIGIVSGTFLVALAVGALIAPSTFSWVAVHPAMWMATGAASASIGSEIARPDRRRLAQWVSSGVGLFIGVSVVAFQVRTGSGSPATSTALALWFVLGIVLATYRVVFRQWQQAIASGLGYTAVVCIGVAFMMTGIWFLVRGRYEGAMDLLIGVPVVYYAVAQLRASGNPAVRIVLALIGYAALTEVVGLGVALKLI